MILQWIQKIIFPTFIFFYVKCERQCIKTYTTFFQKMLLISWKPNLHWISLSQGDQSHDSASASHALIINSTVLFPFSTKPWLCEWPGFPFTKGHFPGHNKTLAWIISLTNSVPLSLWSIVGKPNKLNTFSIKCFATSFADLFSSGNNTYKTS